MRLENITSAHNQKIKDLLALQEKSKLRCEEGLFVVEGCREVSHCLDAGFVPRTLFICGAEVASKERTLDSLNIGKKPLIIVLESVEKPGNLGAVLRSADAADADAVIVCDPLTDLYNPNLIRASLGAIFTRQVAAATSEEAIAWLRSHHIQILTAQLQDSSLYYDTDMTGPTAIVMGTESTGLTDIWRKAADARIRIPMLGRLDSLNVSASAAILLFEALRQRKSQ